MRMKINAGWKADLAQKPNAERIPKHECRNFHWQLPANNALIWFEVGTRVVGGFGDFAERGCVADQPQRCG